MTENLFSLAGKVVLISGASSGLGEHFAEVCARAGAAVAVTARRRERLEQVVATIQQRGGRALAVAMDVTDRASVIAAFDVVVAELGVPDIVVCNAGVTGGKPFLDMEEALWDHVLNTNLKGVWNVGQEAAQRMAAMGNGGSIINIASIVGMLSFAGLSHYATSKAACIQLTKSMAHELAAHRIRVNAIAPGYFNTEMTAPYYDTEAGKKDVANLPLARLGQLSELDGQFLLLASEASSYMSGGVYTIDGAHSVRLS